MRPAFFIRLFIENIVQQADVLFVTGDVNLIRDLLLELNKDFINDCNWHF